MEPGRGDRDDPRPHAARLHPVGGPQWSPVAGPGMPARGGTEAGCTRLRRGSPVAETGRTVQAFLPGGAGHRAAMEPGRGDRDDEDVAKGLMWPTVEPQWSPVAETGMTGGQVS